MKRLLGLLFVVAGVVAGGPLLGSDQKALLADRYEQVRVLRDATTEEAPRIEYDKQLAAIIVELASYASDQILSPRIDELPAADLPRVPETVHDIEALKIILATKLEAVFKRFINKTYLDSNAVVLAETMEQYFAAKLDQMDDNSHAIQAEIVVFVEMARVLLCRMQLLIVSPTLARTLFGELPLVLIDRQRLNDVFVKALYATAFSDNGWKPLSQSVQDDKAVRGAGYDLDAMTRSARYILGLRLSPWPLVHILVQEGVITNSWRLDYKAHRTARRMAEVFTVAFGSALIDLMQRFIHLEKDIAMIPDLKSLQQDAFVGKFIHDADKLIHQLLQEAAVLQQQKDLAAVWANLFIGKTILLKRAMLVRVQIARGGKYEKTRRDIYVKHDVVMQDPLFNEVVFIPELRGYASRYESVITRFLMGQTDPAIDFYHDYQMLLTHLRSLVIKITPQGWRTYVYEITGNGVYAPLVNNMIAILEDVGKSLQFGDSMLGAAQGFVADLLADKGLLTGLAGKEIQAGAAKLGLSMEQLRSVLDGAGGNPKEVILRLLAHASPLLLRGIVDYVRTPEKKPVLKIVSPPGGNAGEVSPVVNSDLVQQIELRAPGLLDLLANHVKAELPTQSA